MKGFRHSRLRRVPPRHLWFFNCPNLLPASPDALLVPVEVADADGLISQR